MGKNNPSQGKAESVIFEKNRNIKNKPSSSVSGLNDEFASSCLYTTNTDSIHDCRATRVTSQLNKLKLGEDGDTCRDQDDTCSVDIEIEMRFKSLFRDARRDVLDDPDDTCDVDSHSSCFSSAHSDLYETETETGQMIGLIDDFRKTADFNENDDFRKNTDLGYYSANHDKSEEIKIEYDRCATEIDEPRMAESGRASLWTADLNNYISTKSQNSVETHFVKNQKMVTGTENDEVPNDDNGIVNVRNISDFKHIKNRKKDSKQRVFSNENQGVMDVYHHTTEATSDSTPTKNNNLTNNNNLINNPIYSPNLNPTPNNVLAMTNPPATTPANITFRETDMSTEIYNEMSTECALSAEPPTDPSLSIDISTDSGMICWTPEADLREALKGVCDDEEQERELQKLLTVCRESDPSLDAADLRRERKNLQLLSYKLLGYLRSLQREKLKSAQDNFTMESILRKTVAELSSQCQDLSSKLKEEKESRDDSSSMFDDTESILHLTSLLNVISETATLNPSHVEELENKLLELGLDISNSHNDDSALSHCRDLCHLIRMYASEEDDDLLEEKVELMGIAENILQNVSSIYRCLEGDNGQIMDG